MRAAISQPLRGHLAMLLFSGLVGGSFWLGARTANEIAPAAFTAARFMVASAVIGVVVLTLGKARRQDRRAAFAAPWRYLLLGGVFASYFVLMFEALKTAAPVSAAAVFTLTPILSAGFGWLLLRQITTPRMALALAIGATGALWVVFRADWDLASRFAVGRGEVIYFVGCAAHAFYTPLVRRLNRGESPLVFTFGTLIAGSMTLLVWGWSDIRATDWAHLPEIVWITLIYTAFFASAATFVLLQYATLRLPASKVMAYTYLTPSWVILWQMALGEAAPRALILAGVGMSVLALALLLRE